MTGCAALLLVNVNVNHASPPLPRPAFALGPVVPGNWLDQQFRVPAGGTARMDIWLGMGDATLDHTPVEVSIFEQSRAEQPLVSLRFDPLPPDAGLFVLRIAPAAGGPSFLAGATKENRYPHGRLWIGPEPAFPDQDVVLTVFDRIPFWRWLALTAERQRDQLVIFIGVQLAAILLGYAVLRRIQDSSALRGLPIPLWWLSVPAGVLLMIPAAGALSITA